MLWNVWGTKPGTAHSVQAHTHTAGQSRSLHLWLLFGTSFPPCFSQQRECISVGSTPALCRPLYASPVFQALPSVQMKRWVNAQSCAPGAKCWWSQNLHFPLDAKCQFFFCPCYCFAQCWQSFPFLYGTVRKFTINSCWWWGFLASKVSCSLYLLCSSQIVSLDKLEGLWQCINIDCVRFECLNENK